MTDAPLRVLVVEDSLTVRGLLVDTLRADPSFEVVGEAPDGRTAIELCERLRPDVITMDMMLPVMTGLAATEYIMAYCPTPIVIVSASTNRGELFKTYDALAAGAVDVLEKPTGDEPAGEWERKLLAAIAMAARIRVITHPRARRRDRTAFGRPTELRADAPEVGPRLVGIGASTGGPAAVLEVLRGLPEGFPLPLLIVLHIDAPFGSALAEWLDNQTPRRVVVAEDGMRVPPVGSGTAVMAVPGRHIEVRGGRIRLTGGPERHFCRPSVDVMFESLAEELGAAAVGCLLTGMGRDGAAGLLALRRRGAVTIAQDEATSVVFGMPREAVLIGGARHVLPLPQIAPALAEVAEQSSRLRGAS